MELVKSVLSGLFWIIALCNTQCPDSPRVGYPPGSIHHHYLTGINQSIILTCERTCGSSYTESWLVFLYSTEDNEMYSVELSVVTIPHFEEKHEELSVQLHRASDACSNDAMVPFSLQLTLNNDIIHSTEGNIIISCSAAFSLNAKVYGSLSMVVYLPRNPGPFTTGTIATQLSTTQLNTMTSTPTDPVTPVPCPGIRKAENRIITTWPNMVVLAVIFLVGGVSGAIVGCSVTWFVFRGKNKKTRPPTSSPLSPLSQLY